MITTFKLARRGRTRERALVSPEPTYSLGSVKEGAKYGFIPFANMVTTPTNSCGLLDDSKSIHRFNYSFLICTYVYSGKSGVWVRKLTFYPF